MDLLRLLRSPAELAPVLGLPIVLVGLVGFVFGGGGDSGKTPSVTVCLIDNDDTIFGSMLGMAGERSSDAAQLNILRMEDMEEALEELEENRATAIIVLPEGLTDAIMTQQPSTVEVITNPRQMLLPDVVVHGLEMVADALSAVSYIYAEPLRTWHGWFERDEAPSEIEYLAMAAGWYRALDMDNSYLSGPVLWTDEFDEDEDDEPEASTGTAVTAVEETPAKRRLGVFDYILPGIGLFGFLFGATSAVGDILRKQRDGRMQRTAVCPIPSRALLITSIVGAVAVAVMVQALIVAIGITVFGVYWGNFLGVALITIAGALAATGLLATLAGLSGSERQFGATSNIAVMAMCMFGGSMFPIDQMPAAMRSLAHFTVNYWMIDGFRILQKGGSILDILQPVVILTVAGIVITFVGARLLARRIERGEVVVE